MMFVNVCDLGLSHACRFRKLRRATFETFGPRPAEQFQRLQEREAGRLAHEILVDRPAWDTSLQRFFCSMTVSGVLY